MNYKKSMIPKLIRITAQQEKYLKSQSKKLKVSEGEVVRSMLDAIIIKPKQKNG